MNSIRLEYNKSKRETIFFLFSVAVRCSIRRCPHPTEAVWSRVKMKISRIEKGNMDEKGYRL